MKNAWAFVVKRYYLPAMSAVAALVLWRNYYAQGMQGLLPYYLDFKRIILSGFDPAAAINGTPTFPMWGYGWVLLITESKLPILLAQNALAMVAVWSFFRYVDSHRVMPREASASMKILLTISIPWYVIHSVMWPYSVSVSLIVLSVVLFLRSFPSDGNFVDLLISGILFGFLLNFRSDYYLMPLCIIALALPVERFKKIAVIRGAAWILSCYLVLVPWALYSKHVTDHYLLASTNGGHVFFIGLGILPDNKWGITPVDSDPTMHALIRAHFGENKPSVVYESDRFLMAEFKRRVSDDPVEYGRKVMYSLVQAISGGVYSGELYERPDCFPRCLEVYRAARSGLLRDPVNSLGTVEPVHIVQLFSKVFGIVVIFLSFGLCPVVLLDATRHRSLFGLLVILIIGYQLLINVLAYQMTTYTSNVYFFHVANLCYGVYVVKAWWAGNLAKRSTGG